MRDLEYMLYVICVLSIKSILIQLNFNFNYRYVGFRLLKEATKLFALLSNSEILVIVFALDTGLDRIFE